MARNRMIKPEFFESETLSRISIEAQMTFIGIWVHCDDYGCCLANTRRLMGQIFPLREDISEQRFKKWIDQLIAERLILHVVYFGKKLFVVKSWREHQKVPNPSKRRYIEVDDYERLMCMELDPNETLITLSLDPNAPKTKEERPKTKDQSVVKVAYASHVLLTEKEHLKLIEKYGDLSGVEWAIEKLNNYKASNGKKYASDYHALIGWVYNEYIAKANEFDFDKPDEPSTPLMLNAAQMEKMQAEAAERSAKKRG